MENLDDPYSKGEQETPKLNPFTSVWLHPKQTAAFMMEHKSMGYAILLFALGYIGALFSGLIDSDIYPRMAGLAYCIACYHCIPYYRHYYCIHLSRYFTTFREIIQRYSHLSRDV